MNCPKCGGRTEVVRTLASATAVARERRCYLRHARWWSTERMDRSTLVIDDGYRADTERIPISQNNDTGINGFPSHSPSGSGSDPLSADPDPERARKSSPRAKRNESADFQAWYGAYPRHVARGDAWKAWQQVESDRPPLVDLLTTISWQRLLPDWTKERGSFVPYPGSYLRGKRWLDERPGVTNGTNGHAAPKTEVCAFHVNYRNDGRAAPYPKPTTCPECKHVALRARRPTEGAPAAIGTLMGGET